MLPMRFDSHAYGPEVARILGLDGDGARPMPLECTRRVPAAAESALRDVGARELFPDAFAPEAALSGLWLYFGGFEPAHSISQDLHTAEGSYWHGILHRQEPDPGNAAYWFRRVGRHLVFPMLHESVGQAAARAGLKIGAEWDPFAFIDFCESARRRPGSAAELCAREIQLAEWQLLFDYCARPR